MTDEPDDYDIPLEGYEAALGNDLSALQARIEGLEAENKNLRYMIIDQEASGLVNMVSIMQLEAKLAKAEWLLVDATVQLEEGKIKTRRNRAALIRQFLAELTGGKDDN